MADELTQSKKHLQKAMWEFVDATYDLDWDRARDSSNDVLMLIQHTKQLQRQSADRLTQDAQDMGLYDV